MWACVCIFSFRIFGLSRGTIDFVQVHSYASKSKGTYAAASPFSVAASYYRDVTKPIVIGEFASAYCKGAQQGLSSCSVGSHYAWALAQGYAGAWDWALNDGVDDEEVCDAGMAAVASDRAVRAVQLGASGDDDKYDDCGGGGGGCSDVAPDDQYTCAEQAAWGKCDSDWMVGFCCLSCFACDGCT